MAGQHKNKVCELCGEFGDDENDMECHKTTLDHHFNFLLHEYKHFRKYKEKNDNNIKLEPSLLISDKRQIDFAINEIKKKVTVQLSLERSQEIKHQIRVQFRIANLGRTAVYVRVLILHPYSYFSLENNNNIYDLNPNEKCDPIVRFDAKCDIISSYNIPLAFTVQPKNNPDDEYTLYRKIKIYISANSKSEEKDFNSPFKEEDWTNIIQTIAPITNAKLCNDFPIPKYLERILFHGLQEFSGINQEELVLCRSTKYFLQSGLNRNNYEKFWQHLLWLDEAFATLQLTKYNMSEVCMRVKRSDELELEVPGLAEKRPSVIAGDIISIRFHTHYICYQGIVNTVTDKTIIIKYVDPELIHIVKEVNNIELDVSFTLTRLLYDRMHNALTTIKNAVGTLFPEAPRTIIIPRDLGAENLKNQSIFYNKEQFMAVKNIVSCTSQKAPYILFGPPGTGKTVTIVEAIYQLFRLYPKKKILVCAPSNAACDMLARKLREFCDHNQLIRIYTGTRNVAEIPDDLKKVSNVIDDDITVVKSSDIAKYNIVVATLHLIGKYNNQHYGAYSPDILFIDEAAQATEPESLIPIAIMSSVRQIILAGDPKQLGPVISSRLAASYGLEISLMERLMDTNDLYKPVGMNPLQYDTNFLTMLVRNYRSHKNIIHIPNELFYDGTLQYVNHNDRISDVFVSRQVCHGLTGVSMCKMQGNSVEFCGILSKEQRAGCSPSFFNEAEIEMVLKYIKCMVNISAFKVKATDIGVISPYIRQVQRIKLKLTDNNLEDVEVGTTESFQGREKRIIIISTVRAQHSLLKYDKQYNLGFVKNARRFNVAITRAIAKVIVVGNPYCLIYDKKNWSKYIEFCQDLNAYFGVEFVPRTDELKRDIMKRIQNGRQEKQKKKGKK